MKITATFGDSRGDVSVFPGGRFTIKRGRCDVRVADIVLKCVSFIGEAANSDPNDIQGDLLATGFFVSVPSAVLSGRVYRFLVTAKHIASDLKDRIPYAVVNKRGGGVVPLKPFGTTWYLHPSDATADIAVIPCNIDADMDAIAIPESLFAIPGRIAELNIGVGDETYCAGLFNPAPGISRTLPIVRHGNIAMLPDEQIQTELWFADVYLIEARSIGGLSGSPVFVRETLAIRGTTVRDGVEATIGGCGRSFLLGVMHGHWDIKESEMNKASIVHDPKRGVNLGIGIVTPAYKILETINQPELLSMRNQYDRDLQAQNVPGMD